MGYQDQEYPNAMELFSHTGEPIEDQDGRLRRRMSKGEGQSIYRLSQLERFYHELREEPEVRLEYDRFLSVRRPTRRL